MNADANANPVARKDGLVLKQLGDELFVYDLERHQAHCLNDTAARVWAHCDGTLTAPEIAKRLETELRAPCDEKIVCYALDGLERNKLLQERIVSGDRKPSLKRRELVRLMATGCLVAIPLILSMPAPTRAQAESCLPNGASCSTNGSCCSGFCNASTCLQPA